MKIAALAPFVVTLATAWITGCGPGLTTRANAASDVELAMNRELANALIGTTTVTNAPMSGPSVIHRAAAAQPVAEVQPPVQTWGAEPEQDPNYNPEYGF